MSVLAANATGNFNAAASWLLCRNGVQPASYTAAGVLVVDNSTPRYTGYFTPGNAADKCQGVMLYVARTPSTANDITVELLEGATVRATATISFQNAATANYGPNAGWVFFKFAAPYTYGNTTAGTWRFKAYGANTQDVEFRYASGATTTLAYYEVSDVAQAPTDNDSILVTGNGTTAGTFNTVVITPNASIALGSASVPAICQSRGGELDWGTSQAASYTWTLTGNWYIHSAEPGSYAVKCGTAANPLTASYIQKFIFVNSAANEESNLLFNEQQGAYLTNYTPPRVSFYGNFNFNQGGAAANYRGVLASDCEIGGTSLVFTTDIGLRAGGGDMLHLSSTEGTQQSETVTTSAYNSATKTATIGATTNKHAAGAFAYNLTSNCVFESSSATYGFTIKGTGYRAAAGTYMHLEMSNVEMKGRYDISVDHLTSTSVINNLKQRDIVDARTYKIGKSTSNYNIFVVTSTCYLQAFNGTINYPAFFDTASTAGYVLINSSNTTINDGLVDGLSIAPYTGFGARINRVRQQAASNYGIFFYNASVDTQFVDCEIGVVPNGITDITFNAYTATALFQARIINCSLGSASQINETVISNMEEGSYIAIQDFNQVADDHRIYRPEGVIRTSGAGQTYTATGQTGKYSLVLIPYTTHAYSTDCLNWEQTKSVIANSRVDITVKMRKNSSYGSTDRPTIYLTSNDGVIDTSVTMVDTDDTWLTYTLTGTVGSKDTFITIKYESCSLNASSEAYFYLTANIYDSAGGTASVDYIGTNLWSGGTPTLDEVNTFGIGSSVIADAVWNALTVDYVAAGSFGKQATDTRVDVNNQGLLP